MARNKGGRAQMMGLLVTSSQGHPSFNSAPHCGTLKLPPWSQYFTVYKVYQYPESHGPHSIVQGVLLSPFYRGGNKFREVQCLARGHTAGKRQSWNLKPELLVFSCCLDLEPCRFACFGEQGGKASWRVKGTSRDPYLCRQLWFLWGYWEVSSIPSPAFRL